jgi:splicing factor 3B subunit 1
MMAGGATPMFAGETPIIMAGPGGAFRAAAEIEWRNRPFTDEEIDSLLPSEGFKIVDPPANYRPTKRPLSATPSPYVASGGFQVAEAGVQAQQFGVVAEVEGLPIRPEDRQYFQKLIDGKTEEDAANVEEAKEIRIMRLLLAIKNGTPPMRKKAFRNISEQARHFGAGPLFAQILPLLLSPTLEDQERHLLVKTIDRVLYRLDDLVRPYVHKILVVIEPLLIDESYIARAEGREIISNLAKAAGLATMIATMRPDIDHQDEYVRNTTARAFAVVGSALGIPALLPFLKAVCRSKKSWQARHTGVKIIQQLAMLLGCAVLPHLKLLVDCMV